MTGEAGSMMRADDVASKLGVSARTVRRYAAGGRIPSRRFGKVYLFSPEWLSSVTSWPPPETAVA